eukprot:scaffold2318_cov396-Prasinococcus_capsulatus_cf.AAC.5
MQHLQVATRARRTLACACEAPSAALGGCQCGNRGLEQGKRGHAMDADPMRACPSPARSASPRCGLRRGGASSAIIFLPFSSPPPSPLAPSLQRPSLRTWPGDSA